MESNYQVSLLRLKNSLGIPGDLPLLLTDSLQYDSTSHFFHDLATYDEVLSNRPDINKQKIGVELSKTLLEQSRAQRLPVLSLVGAYQLQAQSDDRSISSYRWPSTSYMGLQVTVPIFSGNRLHARIRQASIVVRQRETQLLDATENAKTEIVSIERKFEEVLRRIELQQKTVAAAQQNYKIINDRYKNGLSSRLELSDAEIAWSEANLNYLRAVYDIKITKLQLDKARGLLTL